MAAADEDDPKSSSLDELSDLSSTTSSSDGESDAGEQEPEPVEWLATSRAKRSTAGNRMKSLLANEVPADEDSDLELLFAEDENDAGFTDDAHEDASDVQMDSSSDDEDQDDNGDELAGEKELEREARAKRAAQRKRKAQDAIPAKFRKKVRIEQPARPPRPKKKSERTSWLPSPADMPTRASERQTTRISKLQLHQKMVSDELRRRKQLEKMEKKAKLLEAMKKPPMTQAERLAEAAIVEKRNSKSLNRWEEAEKQREEERLKKIAALNSRKLDGPVVTFWSGIQELQEGQAKHVGNLVSMEEKAPRRKRQSTAAARAAKGTGTEASTPTTPVEKPGAKDGKDGGEPAAAAAAAAKLENPDAPTPSNAQSVPPSDSPAAATAALSAENVPTAAPAPASSAPPPPPAPAPMAPPPIPPPPDPRPSTSGVLVAPVLAPPAGITPPVLGYPAASSKSNILAPPNTSRPPPPLSMPPSTPALPSPAAPQPAAGASTPAPNPKPTVAPPPLPQAPNTPAQPAQAKEQPPSAKPPDTPQQPPAPASERPREGKATRSCIILQNFDENAIKDKQVQTQILFGRKMNRLASECPRVPPATRPRMLTFFFFFFFFSQSLPILRSASSPTTPPGTATRRRGCRTTTRMPTARSSACAAAITSGAPCSAPGSAGETMRRAACPSGFSTRPRRRSRQSPPWCLRTGTGLTRRSRSKRTRRSRGSPWTSPGWCRSSRREKRREPDRRRRLLSQPIHRWMISAMFHADVKQMHKKMCPPRAL